jgi:hypothetical protein
MSIFTEVLGFIAAPKRENFAPLALRVFRYQYTNVPPYQALVDGRGVDPARVERIDAIPAVSTLAFKYAQLESQADDASAKSRLFLTSGTTIGPAERGRHLILRPEIYRASAIGQLRRMFFPDDTRLAMLALHPTAERMPESSLSQMITWCLGEFGTESVTCAATREGIDVARAVAFLRARQSRDEPVGILATTAACAKLFAAIDETGAPLVLPLASRLMDTGGAKGQLAPLDAAEVVAAAQRSLGLDPARVINEYGMTEMCSQLYDATPFNSARDDAPGTRVKLAPPWLKPFVLDPATLRPLADGERGMLAFFDLANVGSVSMLMTEDAGMVEGDAVRVLGRAADAEARGCALAIEEFARATQEGAR